MKRYCEKLIENDLMKKMVFIGGPRQVGKTTLAKSLLKNNFPNGLYFNWDNDEDKKAIKEQRWLKNCPLIIFDEIHKFRHWKRMIKGIYDTKEEAQHFMVTGSARLDIYKRGGDSLMGRYHYWRLHPLTIDEIPNSMDKKEAYNRLLNLGGFPEPFLEGDEREARRWRKERFDRILKEDIRDLESIKDISLLRLFVDLLTTRVGGMITISNLAQDLQISPNTAKSWLALLENMYLLFSIKPYTKNLPRSLQKPPKVYFYDNADVVDNKGSRLENLIATTLLKRLHFLEDYYGYRCGLYYIRDKEKREVDFVTIIDNKINELIEVKQSDSEISNALIYYQKLLKPVKAVQIVSDLKRSYEKNGILVTNPIDYFTSPPWENIEVLK